MTISVVINSAAVGPASLRMSSGRRPYGDRAWLLRNLILPFYLRRSDVFGRIVVVGEFEAGNGYEYIPDPSTHFSCADALHQRQRGADAVRGDGNWILFQHDDHLYDETNVVPSETTALVLSPSRWVRSVGAAPLALNDGSVTVDRQVLAPDGTRIVAPGPASKSDSRFGQMYHVNGHACLMRPEVFDLGFRWTDSPPVFTWDIEITRRLADMAIEIAYVPSIRVWDVEIGAEPWL